MPGMPLPDPTVSTSGPTPTLTGLQWMETTIALYEAV
jgi:hypothetical protein